MKRISVIIIALLLCMPCRVYSEVPSGPDTESTDSAEALFGLSLEELMSVRVQSVSKHEERISEAPMSVYVATAEELQRWGVRSYYETAQRVPGYAFYNTDYYGEVGLISRGLRSVWRYGYTIELMPVLDYGHTVFPVPFFKSVEFARGPGGLAWGSNANAGFTNINIKELDGAEVTADYGTFNYRSATAMYGKPFATGTKGDGFFAGIHYKAQDYESEDSALGIPAQTLKLNGLYPSSSILAKINYAPLKLIGMYELSDRPAPAMWFGQEYVRDSTGAWELTDAGRLFKAVLDSTGRAPHDRLQSISYRAQVALPLKSEHLSAYLYHDYATRMWWMESVAEVQDRKYTFGIGADISLLDGDLEATLGGDIYGEYLLNPPTMTGALAERHGIGWFDSSNYGENRVSFSNGFAQVSYRLWDRVKLILGGRIDYQKDAVDPVLFTGPRAGIVYAPLEQLTLKYHYNRVPRRPQTNEIMLTEPRAEELTAHEAAVFWAPCRLFEGNVTLFSQRLTNQIVMVSGSFDDYVNAGGLLTNGVEWALKSMPSGNVLVFSNGSLFFPKVTPQAYTDHDGRETMVSMDHNAADEPLFVPRLTSYTGFEYNIARMVRVSPSVRLVHGIPYRTLDSTEAKIGSWFFDCSITSRRFFQNRVDLSLVGLNLLNNRKPLPAFGEHLQNQNGTVKPEGIRVYGRVRVAL